MAKRKDIIAFFQLLGRKIVVKNATIFMTISKRDPHKVGHTNITQFPYLYAVIVHKRYLEYTSR